MPYNNCVYFIYTRFTLHKESLENEIYKICFTIFHFNLLTKLSYNLITIFVIILNDEFWINQISTFFLIFLRRFVLV